MKAFDLHGLKIAGDHSKVAVVELVVHGLVSYHARCLGCGWKSIGFTKESVAVGVAKIHGEKGAPASVTAVI